MLVSAILCGNCGDIVYSRHRHDMRFCSCGGGAMAGGRGYSKISHDSEKAKKIFFFGLEIPQTEQELAIDWGKGIDKYGKIVSGDREKRHFILIERVKDESETENGQ